MQSFDKIADENEVLSQRINALSKEIDEEFAVVKRAMLSCGGGGLTISSDLRHCAEYLEVNFQPPPSTFLSSKEPAAPTQSSSSFKLSGTSLRKCSKVQALSSVLEDLEELLEPVVVKTAAKEQPAAPIDSNAAATTTTAVEKPMRKGRKRSLELEDSDDDATPRAAADPVDSFVVSVSLDDIKRTFGASESLLVEQSMSEEVITLNEQTKALPAVNTEAGKP